MKKAAFKIATLLFAVIICCCELVSKASAQDDSYVTTTYNELNGLPTGEANDVIQTSDGYIWIGSYGGLIRYDGSSFRNYSTEGALPSSSIRSLFEDSKGRLWIGTNDIGIYLFENDRFTNIECEDENSFLCIRDFCENEDGRIYCASNSGIGEIQDGVLQPLDIKELYGETVYSCAVDSRNRIWGAMNMGRCAVISSPEHMEFVESSDIFQDTQVYCLAGDRNGDIYLGTSGNMLAKLNFASDSLQKDDINIEYYTTGNVSTHNKLRITPDGKVLIGGLVGFGILFPDGEFTEFSDSDKAASVNSAVCDYEGNYWLASSYYGVVKYANGCFTSFNKEMALDGIALNTIVLNGGKYYAGTDNGLLIYDSMYQPEENELSHMLEGIRIRHMINDTKNNLWIASYNGVFCYYPETGEMATYSTENGLVNNAARVLMQMSNGDVVVGTQGGISIISDGKVIRNYTDNDGVSVQQILCLYEASDGTLLAGSDGGGIYAVKDETVTEHSFSEGLGEGVVLRIISDSQKDNAYFVSAGSSLYYWENNTFTKLSNLNKCAGSIFDMYEKEGKLWILQNSGLFAVDKEKLLNGESEKVPVYGFTCGLSGSLNANTWHWLENGSIYLATRNGISIFDFEGPEYQLPKLIINDIVIDDMVIEHPDSIELGKDARRMTINFAALSFTDNTEISVSYMLDGFDKEETVITGEKSGNISYTNIPGGRYNFKIKIYDPANPEICTEMDIEVNKVKHIYEYAVFWIVFALVITDAIVFIMFIIYRFKLSAIRRRQSEYRGIVEQALQTIAGTIDAKDKYTNGHSLRVAQYSKEIAKRMGMSEEKQENIYYVAILHDIGKIGIPDSILNKPGKLTDEEYKIICSHPKIGGEILKNFTALEGAEQGAKYHHERYDGKGYNEHLKGKEIPLVARIIGVADAYDAMSSNRCYRNALSREKIIEELKNGSGSQFDPEIVPFMLDMINDGTVGN